MLYLLKVHNCTHLVTYSLSQYKAIPAPFRYGNCPAAVSHSPWLCFHSQDRLSVCGRSAFSAPGVNLGINSSQKYLPQGWLSSALLLCPEDTSRAEGKSTGKPRGSLTKLCLQQDMLVQGRKDHHTGLLQAPRTQLAEQKMGCWW